MKYNNIHKATFLSRPNRFIANVLLNGVEETVHVKNTGRCRELLVPGCTVYLEKSSNPQRKTAYDLVCVEKILPDNSSLTINMDSQAVNLACEEWLPLSGLFSADAKIKREHTHASSRFDFYIEDNDRRGFIEVKGVTLESKGAALFPDAPTLRGVKHLRHLCECISEGYFAKVIFIIQMKGIKTFSANAEMHPEFAKALKEAALAGVEILAYDCKITPDSMTVDSPVRVLI